MDLINKKIEQILTPEVLKIINLIESQNEQIRIVGGAVRDLLAFGYVSKDIDFATTAKPEKIKNIFKNTNFTVISIGEKFGSIAVLSNITKLNYEITTLRSDLNQNGRHADVIFEANFETDSHRRDFTMNALYLDNKGNIYDYHEGLQDLKNNTVKFIGDPEIRIKEDYLRIMRFFRFSGKFGGNLEPNGLLACKKLAKNITKISKERFTLELIAIAKQSKKILIKMQEIDLFEYWFEKKTNIFNNYNFEKLNKAQIITVIFGKNINLNKLDITRKERKFIEFCWQNWFAIEAKNITNELKILALDYDLSKVLQINNYISPFKAPILPINGTDIKAESKKIGIILKKAKQLWVESNYLLTKQSLLKLLNNY